MSLGGLYVVLNTYQLLKITINIPIYFFFSENILNLLKCIQTCAENSKSSNWPTCFQYTCDDFSRFLWLQGTKKSSWDQSRNLIRIIQTIFVYLFTDSQVAYFEGALTKYTQAFSVSLTTVGISFACSLKHSAKYMLYNGQNEPKNSASCSFMDILKCTKVQSSL